jgi:23S rRNA (uracil-5-)-methyltransferase RumA
MSSKRFQKLTLAALKTVEHLPEWRCPHFPECGGCALQDVAYSDQLAAKRAALLELWSDRLPEDLRADYTVVGADDPFEYRLRMDYVCSDDRFGLRMRKRFFAIVDLQECHLIPPRLFEQVHAIYTFARGLGIPDYNVYYNTGFLRYLVVRRNIHDGWLLSFVTSERAYEPEIARAADYALEMGATSVWWLLNPRHADLSFGEPLGHWGEEYLPQYVLNKQLMMGPNTFFQNNVGGFEDILRYVTPYLAGAPRLFDFYAGVGTIGITLGDQVQQVVAAELSEESVALMRRNVELNGMADRVEIRAGDVVDMFEAERQSGDVLVLDPPRAGLGADVCKRLLRSGFDRIVYISCNPITQIADCDLLASSYRIVAVRGFDLFPQTFHVENVVVLDRIAEIAV